MYSCPGIESSQSEKFASSIIIAFKATQAATMSTIYGLEVGK